jgi:hypothetical protein
MVTLARGLSLSGSDILLGFGQIDVGENHIKLPKLTAVIEREGEW